MATIIQGRPVTRVPSASTSERMLAYLGVNPNLVPPIEEAVVPGAEASQQAVDTIVPEMLAVPPLGGRGNSAVQFAPPLEPTSTPEDLAMLSQSPMAGRERYSVENVGGVPVMDPATGANKVTPVGMDQYAKERANQLQSLPNYSQIDSGKSPTEYASEVLQEHARSTGKMTPEHAREIENWADTSGNIFGIIQDRTMANLFTQPKFFSTNQDYLDAGLKVPAATELIVENGLEGHEKNIATAIGVGMSMGVGQTLMYKDADTKDPVSPTGRTMTDARPLVDIINSTMAFAQNALDNMGYSVPPEVVRKFATIQAHSEIADGNLIEMKDERGRSVFGATPDTKDYSRKMSYLAEALSGDTKRKGVSYAPNISGSTFTAPGSQLTKGSITPDGTKATNAEVVKDLLSSIQYVYRPMDVAYKELELNMIQEAMEPEGRWSNSEFAKRNKVSKANYNAAMAEFKPPEGYDPADPQQVEKFQKDKAEHARSVINDKLKLLNYDVNTAKGIAAPFYISLLHDNANQRFYENTRGADATNSKTGVREMRNPLNQDWVRPTSLFDSKEVERIKREGTAALYKNGNARQTAFDNMNISDLNAVGTMIAAVINYNTVVNSDKTVLKLPESVLLGMYTPAIGGALAQLGAQYKAFMANPKQGDHTNIKQHLAAMPTGEALGNKNLWDSLDSLLTGFNDPNLKQKHVLMSYLNFDDGNQNGIFLQSLFYGDSPNARRLGTFDPTLNDMRQLASGVIKGEIKNLLKDNPEALAAWGNFFDDVGKDDKFAADMFKKPIMRNSYGMDASMFETHIFDFLVEKEDAFTKHVLDTGVYKDMGEAAAMLNRALEATLHKIVNQQYSSVVKAAGRMMAAVGGYPILKAPDGDDMVLTPVSLQGVNQQANDKLEYRTLLSGERVMVKNKAYKTVDIATEGGDVISTPIATRQANPAFHKGVQTYYHDGTGEVSTFKNFAGSGLKNYMAVMPIQGADGSLVKLTTLAVNKNRTNKAVLPVSYNHDAINSTGAGALYYRNAYNNIAIPQAIPEIAKFGKRLEAALMQEIQKTKTKVSGMGTWIGIGEDGDYPGMGGLFDELYEKIRPDGSYKNYFLLRQGYDVDNKSVPSDVKQKALSSWDKYSGKIKDAINEAKKLGWREPGSIDENIRAVAVVKQADYIKMIDLAGRQLKLFGDSDSKLHSWAANFENKVLKTGRDLALATKQGGIGQMTASGGAKAMSADKLYSKPITGSPEPSTTNQEETPF